MTERFEVAVGDGGIVDRAGTAVLGALSERLGLSAALSSAVVPRGERAPVHDRGRLLSLVAVMLADGGECLSDLSVLRNQPQVWGPVPSDTTAWRAFGEIDTATLERLAGAQAQVRAEVWDRAEAGSGPVVIDVDATLVEIHSENKEHAAAHFKGGYGFHPIVASCDNTSEVLAARLRPGNAGANSAADQLDIVDRGIGQLPAMVAQGHRCGDPVALVARPVVVRADSAGAVKDFVAGLRARNIGFSVTGRATDGVAHQIRRINESRWQPAITQDGEVRSGAHVVELDAALVPSGWPEGTRIIVRREHAHPGAQLRIWDDGYWRYQTVLTDQRGDPVDLEAHHRAHAHVEDRIKALKDLGLSRMPFAAFAANQVWLFCVVLAQNLTRWFQLVGLEDTDPLAQATPKTLRYRLFHIAGRLIRHARRTILRIEATWPWADTVSRAWRRIAAPY